MKSILFYFGKKNKTKISITTSLSCLENTIRFIECQHVNFDLYEIVLSNNIDTINRYEFSGLNLWKIDIPNRVTKIEEGAFYDCRWLQEIRLPDSLEIIGKDAFYECTRLTEITIPKNVVDIGYGAFRYSGLTKVNIEGNLKTIGEYAFNGCTNLTEIYFNATACNDLSSDNYVFAYAGQDGKGITVNFGDGVTIVPNRLFYSYYDISYSPNIKQINWNNVTEIGSYAFAYCNMTSLVIPDTITTIGENAFYNCTNLQSLTIGSGVNTIGDYAFSGATALTELNFNAINCDDLGYRNYVFRYAGQDGEGTEQEVYSRTTRGLYAGRRTSGPRR